MSGPSVWTDEMVEHLREGWKAGLSSAQIGKAIEARFGVELSRNAVIGKVHRMRQQGEPGISGRVEPQRQAKPVRMKKASDTLIAKPQPAKITLPRIAMTPRTGAVKPPSLAAQRAVQGPLKTVGISITDLKQDGQCRYVLGAPEDMFFCGAATGTNKAGKPSPYCPHHHHLCHDQTIRTQPLRRGMAGAQG